MKNTKHLAFEKAYYEAYGYDATVNLVSEAIEFNLQILKEYIPPPLRSKIQEYVDSLRIKKYNNVTYTNSKVEDAWNWFETGYLEGQASTK